MVSVVNWFAIICLVHDFVIFFFWSRCLGIAGCDLVSFLCMVVSPILLILLYFLLFTSFFGILLWEFSRAKELGALVCSWNFAFGRAIGLGQRRRCSYYPTLGVDL